MQILIHHKRVSAWRLLFLLLAAGIALLIWKWPRERRLLDHAQRITTVSDWDEDIPNYFWLSDQSLLFLRVRALTNNAVEFSAYKFDRKTGTESAFPRLEQPNYKHRSDKPVLDSVSPNGGWLLLRGVSSGSCISYCISLQGKDTEPTFEIYTCPDCGENLMWMGKGHQLLQIGILESGEPSTEQNRVVLHNPVKPKELKELTHSDPFNLHCSYSVTSDNRLVCYWDEPEANKCHVQEWQIGASLTKIRDRTVPLVHETSQDLLLDPDGDKVAWISQEQYTPPLDAMLHHLVHSYRTHSIAVDTLWVCRLDGSARQEIGHSLPDNIGSIHWLPGGKQISFTHDGALYVVDAE